MKYKILENDFILHKGKKLFRIQALKDFGLVEKGDIGGYVESYDNLSQSGDCWIHDNAKAYDNSLISEDAEAYDTSEVYDDAEICGSAKILNKAEAFGNSLIGGRASLVDNAKAFGNSSIHDTVVIGGNAKIYGYSSVRGDVKIFGNSLVCCTKVIYGNFSIYGNSIIEELSDYFVFKASGRQVTFCKDTKLGVNVTIGCQQAISLDKFVKRIYINTCGANYTDDDLPLHRQEYLAMIDYVEKFMLKENK